MWFFNEEPDKDEKVSLLYDCESIRIYLETVIYSSSKIREYFQAGVK